VILIKDHQCSSICARFHVSTGLMLIILVFWDVTFSSAYFNITLSFEAPSKYQPSMIKALLSFKMSRDINCQLHSIKLQKTCILSCNFFCSPILGFQWNVILRSDNINTFAATYLNTQGLNNSCLKSRQRRP